MAQRSSGCLILAVLACLIAGVAAWLTLPVDALKRFFRPPETVRDDSGANELRPENPLRPGSQESFEPLTLADLEATLTPQQRARASWENPFVAALWHAPDWQFDEDAMLPAIPDAGPATFRRPYRQFAMNLTVEPFTLPGDGDRDDLSETGESTEDTLLTVDLLTRSGTSSLLISLSPERVRIRSRDGDLSRELFTTDLRDHSGESEPEDSPTETASEADSDPFAIALTPNRLLIRRGGRLLANVPRPGALLGSECFVRFERHRSAVRLSRLRIEGD